MKKNLISVDRLCPPDTRKRMRWRICEMDENKLVSTQDQKEKITFIGTYFSRNR